MSKPNYRIPFLTKLSNNIDGYGVVPSHYNIKLVPHVRENEVTFDGEVSIDFKNLNKRSSLKLNAKNLEIVENVILKNDDETYKSTDYNIVTVNTKHILTINFNRDIAVGAYNLNIHYKGQVNESTKVLKNASYFDKSGKRQWMLLSDFETEGIQEVFPCWKDEWCHTKFEFSIKHNKEYRALSNAPVKEIITADDPNSVWTIFEKTPTFSPNHFAFIVGNLEYLSAHYDDPFKLWFPKNTIDLENNDIKIVHKLWTALEDVTGVTHKEHKYSKLDVVVLPEFIEMKKRNWGICIVNDVSIGLKENIDKIEKVDTITDIAISMIDHWFGGLVTSVNYHGKPSNYRLRFYLAELIVDKIDKTWHSIDRFINKQGQEGNWNEFYNDYISRTIEYVLGKDNFRTALRNYILNNESKDEIVSELYDEIVKVSGDMKETMKKVLENWNTFSSFPTVTVTRNYESNKAIITQARFLDNPESDWRYWVPLNWATQDDPNFEDTSVAQWHDGVCMEIEIPVTVSSDRWIILNKQNFGTYRVNYDEKNWKLIINYLKTNNYSKIHRFNRIQLINDAFTIADLEFLDYSIPLELAEYLTRETEFGPWVAFLHHIEKLYYESPIRGSAYYANFKKYVLKLTDELEKRILLSDETNDDFTTRLLRISLVNVRCISGSSVCGNYALTKLKNWLDDPNKYPISSDMKVMILNSGIRFADENTWNKLWQKYKLSLQDPKNKKISSYDMSKYEFNKEEELLNALGCISNDELLNKFIIMILRDVIEDVDPLVFLKNFNLLNDKAPDAILDFIKSKPTKADGTSLLSEELIFDIVQSLASFIITDDQLQKVFIKFISMRGEKIMFKQSFSEYDDDKYLIAEEDMDFTDKYFSESNEKLNQIKIFFESIN